MAHVYECEECKHQDPSGSSFVLFQGEVLLCKDETACHWRKGRLTPSQTP